MSDSSTYEVGYAKIDVTPRPGGFLAGYAARQDPSTGVYHPLRAVATALGDGRTDAVLISVEWLGFYERTEEARARISDRTGLDPALVILCGTHTHCGPAIRLRLSPYQYGPTSRNRRGLSRFCL